MENFYNLYEELSGMQEGLADTLAILDTKKSLYTLGAGKTAEEVDNFIKTTYGSKTPVFGSIFITPDGTFIRPAFEGATHSGLIVNLECRDFITPTPEYEKARMDGRGAEMTGEALRDLLGYVFCNNDLYSWSYINLPTKITSAQLYAIEEWLEQEVFARKSIMTVDVVVGRQHKDYPTSEYFSEDIINRIRRYYSSGTLYEEKKL